jgi:flagellar FliL protein
MSAEIAETKADDARDADQAAKKSPRLVLAVLAAAAICGVAGVVSYMAAPMALGASTKASNEDANRGHDGGAKPRGKKTASKTEKEQSNAKKAGAGKREAASAGDAISAHSTFVTNGSIGVFLLRPIIVSLKPQGRIRYLKVSLAVETTPESEHVFIDHELRIVDILNSYLRAVPLDAIEDPAVMERIREQIARRVSFIVDPAPVQAVLITDFILS